MMSVFCEANLSTLGMMQVNELCGFQRAAFIGKDHLSMTSVSGGSSLPEYDVIVWQIELFCLEFCLEVSKSYKMFFAQ
jgi:hypothetical protein